MSDQIFTPIKILETYLDEGVPIGPGLIKGKLAEIREHATRLVDDAEWLSTLYSAGIDSWEGYEYAQELYNNENA